MLALAEKLLLIALDDQPGKMNMNASQSISYGLAGAIIANLELVYNINDKVKLSNATFAGMRQQKTKAKLLY
ncbi:GPP34 family phosphoprotein [Bacillus sp. JCM 19034]|uniref:GPP34 family phosphoprotein n=1 Tax=Bacillus sp. JCM 19034 TaxID=1481928 RepID=UPI000785F6F7|nr:GPP34 family phosphoprotein [Bacillus sp. JCM 19034]